MPLDPPIKRVFASLQLAEDKVTTVAMQQGFAATRLRSKSQSTGMSGSSRGIPFGSPADSGRGELSRVGARPRVIVAAIRAQREGVTVLSRDVYNERCRARDEALRGRTPIEALLDDLRDDGILHDVQVDESNQVTHLFFALAEGVELARQHSQVVLTDSTYKTNRFKMPLLHVVGATATNQTFSICFCFMKSERAADYLWALSRVTRCFLQGQTPRVVVTDRESALMSAVRSILPSTTTLLCSWHIEKNIVANVKKNFATEQNFQAFMSDWIVLANCIDVESFESEWSRFQATYGSAGQTTAYLSTTWIAHKDKFVLVWTKRVLHFGHLVTSRVEGNHSMVKGWIATSTGDLNRVVDCIKLVTDSQVREIKGRVAFERSNNLFVCAGSLWTHVIRKVSRYALKTAALQLAKTTKCLRERVDLLPCSGVFTSTLGLPCSHRLRELVTGGRQLQLADFDEQWRLEKPVVGTIGVREGLSLGLDAVLDDVERSHGALRPHQQLPFEQWIADAVDRFETRVRDPSCAQTRGRPSLSAATTQRDPCAFERTRVDAVGLCGRCHRPGHNIRTCTTQLQG